MNQDLIRRSLVVLGIVAVIASTAPAQAQETPLFERFSLKLEGSFVDLSTQIRLDSNEGDLGTTLSFEDTLGLDSSKVIPSVAFEWQVGRKHRLAVRWQDISRDSSAQALTEIRWGDEVIPLDAAVFLSFDITQTAVDYTFYPWVRDRWAAGFGFGLRVLDVYAELRWEELTVGGGGDSADGTGPLPYFSFEYRRLLSDTWRFKGQLGWLQVNIGDVDGGQWVGNLTIEYLLGDRWGFGAALNYSTVNVDWTDDAFTGRIDMDINDLSLFARLRF